MVSVMHPLRIALIGQGKLGSSIIEAATAFPSITLFPLRAHQVRDHLSSLDLVLDVSIPSSFAQYEETLIKASLGAVIGVTGYNAAQQKALHEASTLVPLMLCPNFSYGIAVLQELLSHLPEHPYQLQDIHHKNKRDAPSGTAIQLSKALKGPVTITSQRTSDVVGTHTIELPLEHETITITHTAHSRQLFALGAIKACQFLYGKPKGLYTHYYEPHSNTAPLYR